MKPSKEEEIIYSLGTLNNRLDTLDKQISDLFEHIKNNQAYVLNKVDKIKDLHKSVQTQVSNHMNYIRKRVG